MRIFRKKDVAVEGKGGHLVVVDNSPGKMLDAAIGLGASVEEMERLYDLRLRYEQNEARKAYTAAMAAFKEKPPEIFKDKDVAYGNTEYSHASLGNVVTTINSHLGKHGLSASWKTEQPEGQVKVTCTVTHVAGHSESTSLTAPPDNSGTMNNIQRISSTTSYLKRYTILDITGCAALDEFDDDGRSCGKQNRKGKTVDAEIPLCKFEEGVDYFATNNKSEEDIDNWLTTKQPQVLKMSAQDQGKLASYVKQTKDLMRSGNNSTHQPTTIDCPKGAGEVTKTDCGACTSQCDKFKEKS